MGLISNELKDALKWTIKFSPLGIPFLGARVIKGGFSRATFNKNNAIKRISKLPNVVLRENPDGSIILTCMNMGITVKDSGGSHLFVPVGFKIKGTNITAANWDKSGHIIPMNDKNSAELYEFMAMLSKASVRIAEQIDDLKDIGNNPVKLVFIDQE